MKTLTVTAARQNLGHWLKLAVQGEEVGVLVGSEVVAFRRVPITAADYGSTEYGLTASEAGRAEKKIARSIARERRAGTVTGFSGDWKQLRS